MKGNVSNESPNSNKPIMLFLDSGAFSAWTKKVKIDLVEYTNFALENQHLFEVIASLDEIPGQPDKIPTAEEVEQSAAQGWKNYQYMLEQGIDKEKLIHTFHMGEDYKWLEKMVEEVPYIALGGFAKGSSTPEKIAWLDECMNYITDKNGMPKVKFHGFGMTSHKLLFRYPWYSVDSTTWLRTGMYGGIFVPHFRNGKWQYKKPPWKMSVSSKNPKKSEAGLHIDSISPMERQLVLNYIAEKGYKLGRSSYKMVHQNYILAENEIWASAKSENPADKREVEIIEERGLCNDYRLRNEISNMYYRDLQEHFPPWPWAFKGSEIPRLL